MVFTGRMTSKVRGRILAKQKARAAAWKKLSWRGKFTHMRKQQLKYYEKSGERFSPAGVWSISRDLINETEYPKVYAAVQAWKESWRHHFYPGAKLNTKMRKFGVKLGFLSSVWNTPELRKPPQPGNGA